MRRVQLHRDALPVELNVSTCREQRRVVRRRRAEEGGRRKEGRPRDSRRSLPRCGEPKQDLVEAFANLNESVVRYLFSSLLPSFSLSLFTFVDSRSGRAISPSLLSLVPSENEL